MPDLSPDGLLLLYTAKIFPSEISQVWTMSLDGGLPTQLRDGQHARWSPDGLSIVFVAVDPKLARQKIWQMAPNGTSSVQLTHSIDCDDVNPSYSPDMSKIVFASNRAQTSAGLPNFDVWIMEADGSATRQLTTNGSHDDLPAFHPNGQMVYFRSNRGGKWDLWLLELE
jgi:TolB protein